MTMMNNTYLLFMPFYEKIPLRLTLIFPSHSHQHPSSSLSLGSCYVIWTLFGQTASSSLFSARHRRLRHSVNHLPFVVWMMLGWHHGTARMASCTLILEDQELRNFIPHSLPPFLAHTCIWRIFLPLLRLCFPQHSKLLIIPPPA